MPQEPHVCVDQILPNELLKKAAELAIKENPANQPAPQARVAAHHPFGLALVTGKQWTPGRVLKVRFLEGDPAIQAKVQQYANVWCEFANIKFDFNPAGKDTAEIRISFQKDGSWSVIGTDALVRPANQPTMNFGWLTQDTADTEYSRVVTHEFGHALGCIHEHQNPGGGIEWNRDAVYKYYQGPPNNWPKEQVDVNLFQKYDESIASHHTDLDPDSIMMYPIPAQFTMDGFTVGMNTELSEMDKEYINEMYPFD